MQHHDYVIFIRRDDALASTKSCLYSAWWPHRVCMQSVLEGGGPACCVWGKWETDESFGYNFFHFTLENLLKYNFCLISNKQRPILFVCAVSNTVVLFLRILTASESQTFVQNLICALPATQAMLGPRIRNQSQASVCDLEIVLVALT